MAARKQHKPAPSIAEAIAIVTSELARLHRIDTGESVPEALELARAELADEKREHRRSIDAYDRMRAERDAIVEQRDRIRAERDAAHARLATLESRPAAQTIELQLREQIAELERRLDPDVSTIGAQADHHALCWRALRDAIVSIQGATELEGDARVASPDHPLESFAEAVLRASEGAASMGALSCARTLAAELHALAIDATAWRTFVRAISDDDWRKNPCDESSAGSDMHDRIARLDGRDRHAWTRAHAGVLGEALASAAMEGLAYAQTAADDMWRENAERGDKLEAEGEHGPWWRAFVSAVCGSPQLDGSPRRIAWAMRRGGLPVTSADDSIETVEACAEMIRDVLDRMVTHAA